MISDDSDEFDSGAVSIALTLAIDLANSNDLTSEVSTIHTNY